MVLLPPWNSSTVTSDRYSFPMNVPPLVGKLDTIKSQESGHNALKSALLHIILATSVCKERLRLCTLWGVPSFMQFCFVFDGKLRLPVDYQLGCTVAAVSAHRLVEHVKNALQNITNEGILCNSVPLTSPCSTSSFTSAHSSYWSSEATATTKESRQMIFLKLIMLTR